MGLGEGLVFVTFEDVPGLGELEADLAFCVTGLEGLAVDLYAVEVGFHLLDGERGRNCAVVDVNFEVLLHWDEKIGD